VRSFHLPPLPASPTLPRRAGAKRAAQAYVICHCNCNCHCRCHCDPRRRTHRTPQTSTHTRNLEWPAAPGTILPLQTTDPQSQPWTPRAFVTASRPRSTPTLPSASKQSSTSSMCVCPYPCPCPCPCPCPPRVRGRPTDRATGRGAARLHRWPAERAAAGAGARHPPVK
jgi:hypothetical protein